MELDKLIKLIDNGHKKVIVFGNGKIGKRVINILIPRIKRLDNLLICDNDRNKQGVKYKGIEIMPIESAAKENRDAVYIIATTRYVNEMKKQLLENEISEKNIYVDLPDSLLHASEIRKWSEKTKKKKILNFEVNINKHCNLKCCGCDHFAPLADEDFYDINEYKSDIERLSYIFDGAAGTILLLGGEPLLNPQINQYASIARKNFPEAKIAIITNGILLESMEEKFWKNCCACDISIAITKYPIKINYDKIEKIGQEFGVKIEYMELGDQESRLLWKYPLDINGNQDAIRSFTYCENANTCITLEHGYLYTCSIMPNAYIFNNFFHTKLKITDVDGVDIYDDLTPDDIFSALARPVSFCRYCDVMHRSYGHKWRISEKKISEWTDTNT